MRVEASISSATVPYLNGDHRLRPGAQRAAAPTCDAADDGVIIVPSDELLVAEIQKLKAAFSGLGVNGLASKLHAQRPVSKHAGQRS